MGISVIRRARTAARSTTLPSTGVTFLLMLALVASALGASTGSAQAEDSEEPEPAPTVQYVSLGDSYTAAPRRNGNGCQRSRANYPSRVADQVARLEHVDVSCAGASTRHMFRPQTFNGSASVPPQLKPLSDATRLVTVSIGANNSRFFSRMVHECLRLASRDRRGAPCRRANRKPGRSGRPAKDLLVADAKKIRGHVTNVVKDVRRRAPEAQVIVVGYPRLLPDRGRCQRRMPLAHGDYSYVRKVNRLMASSVATAARRLGVDFVDVFAASRGHDVCSSAPWITGVKGLPGQATAFHPLPREQQAVARMVADRISPEILSPPAAVE